MKNHYCLPIIYAYSNQIARSSYSFININIVVRLISVQPLKTLNFSSTTSFTRRTWTRPPYERTNTQHNINDEPNKNEKCTFLLDHFFVVRFVETKYLSVWILYMLAAMAWWVFQYVCVLCILDVLCAYWLHDANHLSYSWSNKNSINLLTPAVINLLFGVSCLLWKRGREDNVDGINAQSVAQHRVPEALSDRSTTGKSSGERENKMDSEWKRCDNVLCAL